MMHRVGYGPVLARHDVLTSKESKKLILHFTLLLILCNEIT